MLFGRDGLETKIRFMTATPAISIVIPTRNRCELLRETVASVTEQTFGDWELIIVDDASEDSTRDWLQNIDDPRVRPIRMERNAERGRCRNLGLQLARGEFILFLDDDDLLAKTALHLLSAALIDHPQAIASIGGYIVFDEIGAQLNCPIIKRTTVRHVWEDVLFGWVAVGGQCLMRTNSVRAVDGWNESFRIADDHELWSRLAHLGPVVLLPAVTLKYRVHSGQWRPPNTEDIMTAARAAAVRNLSGRERERADRILEARALAGQAYDHYLRAEAGKALQLYFKSLRSMPDLLRSPLRRRMVLSPMAKCLAGSAGLKVVRPLVSLWWRVRRKAITVTGDLESDKEGRLHSEKKDENSESPSGPGRIP
jgi:glycosyltransferase involved in cell wall biosynthesis